MDSLDIIHAHTAERISQGKLVCAATLVAQSGKIIWHERQGRSDYEAGEPLKSKALFRLASMTKPITAAAAMIQVERKKIDLYENVSRYLPAFRNMSVAVFDENGDVVSAIPAKNEMRLIDLLTHTNGMGLEDPFGPATEGNLHPKPGETLRNIVPRLGSLLLAFDPRTKSGYSQTLAFDTMASIIEMTSGMEYASFLNKHIFEPLGMQDTTFTPDAGQWKRMVRTYRIAEGRIALEDMEGIVSPFSPLSYASAGAGLAGTIEDYFRFAQMLANGGELNGERIISSDGIRYMRTAKLPADMPGLSHGINWGLGMRVVTSPNVDSKLNVGSYGWSGAFGTHFWIDPRNRLLAIYCTSIMGNRGAGPETYEFEGDVMASVT